MPLDKQDIVTGATTAVIAGLEAWFVMDKVPIAFVVGTGIIAGASDEIGAKVFVQVPESLGVYTSAAVTGALGAALGWATMGKFKNGIKAGIIASTSYVLASQFTHSLWYKNRVVAELSGTV